MSRSNNVHVTDSNNQDHTFDAFFRYPGNQFDDLRNMDTDMYDICKKCYKPIAFYEATASHDFKEITQIQYLAKVHDAYGVFVSHKWQQVTDINGWKQEDGSGTIYFAIWSNRGVVKKLTKSTWKKLAEWRKWMMIQHQKSVNCTPRVYQKQQLESIGRATKIVLEDFQQADRDWREGKRLANAQAQQKQGDNHGAANHG